MSGRRNLGTAGAAFLAPISQVVGMGITEDFKARDERRQLINRIANDVARGEATGRFPSGSTNTFLRTRQLSPATSVGGLSPSASMEDLLQSGATITHPIKTPQGTIAIKRGGQKAVKPPSEAEANRLSLGTQPGQPFPATATMRSQFGEEQLLSPRVVGGLPSSPGGTQLLQGMITQGQTESPSATMQRPGLMKQPTAPVAPTGSMVVVQAANGEVVQIPRQNLQEAIRRGAKVVQQ